MQEEPFVPIAPFENFYELIMRANSLPYGLAGYAFTCSLATATRASEALEVGMGGVNDLLLATAEMPFGGVRSVVPAERAAGSVSLIIWTRNTPSSNSLERFRTGSFYGRYPTSRPEPRAH